MYEKGEEGGSQVGVSLVGFPLLVLGIILIPLPGPGVLICLVAFFVLSLEFDWAEKYLEKAKATILKIYHDAKDRADKITQEK